MKITDFKDAIIITQICDPNGLVYSEWIWESLKIRSSDQIDFKVGGALIKKYTPKAKDRLYFYPGCKIPRYKVRDWGKKHNISITVMKDKATVKIAHQSSIIECIGVSAYVKLIKEDFITWIKSQYDMTNSSTINFINALNDAINPHVYISKATTNTYDYIHGRETYGPNTGQLKARTKERGVTKPFNDVDFVVTDYYYGLTLDDKGLDNLTSLTTDVDTYHQDVFTALINEDAIIIDKDMYNRLRDMLSSTNKSDHVVAVEIIANSNIDPSLHHILLLMKEFASVLVNTKETTHVNFKSLLEYINVHRSSMLYLNEDKIMSILMDKDVLNKDNIAELAVGVKTIMKNVSDTAYFKIAKITVSEDVKKYIINKQNTQNELINNTINQNND